MRQGIQESHDRLRARLSQGLLLADGAIGTMLHARGLERGTPPELWNLTHPKKVEEVHRAYVGVGCDLIQTNTFGANRFRLKTSGLAEQMAAINATAVHLARRACAPIHFVAGTIGPTGCFHRGTHAASSGEVVSAFAEQIAQLVRAEVDLLLIETMTHLAEARIVIEAAEAWSPVPIAVSLVFFKHGGKFHTADGASPQEAVQELQSAQVVGCNCMHAEDVAEVLCQMREVTALPLIGQPHAGVPERRGEEWIYPQDPATMVRHIPRLLASQPGIVGGCCGTTPSHLAAIRQSLHHS